MGNEKSLLNWNVYTFSSDKRGKYLQRKEKCLKHFNANELKFGDEKEKYQQFSSNIEVRYSDSG